MDPRIEDRFDEPYDVGDAEQDFLLTAERIGPPLQRARSSMLSASVAIAIMLAGGWGIMATRDIWQPPLAQLIAKTEPTVQTAPAQAKPEALAKPLEIGEAPGRDAGTPAASEPQAPAEARTDQEVRDEKDASSAGVAEDSAQKSSDAPEKIAQEPLPPPAVDPKDPLQKQAFAAGLHPDLSRSLLSRLSKTDFQNASTAIKKALIELKDGGVLVWPAKTPKTGAQFEVRFVAAAAPECRRYVVTVIKDRWSTTAQPMEKCGAELPARRTVKASG